MDNPYMTAAFMGQMQTGLQNAAANFTRAYEGAADRRQQAYLEGERNRFQMEQAERQRQFENQRQAAQFGQEKTMFGLQQTGLEARDLRLFGQNLAEKNVQHAYDVENAGRQRGYALQDQGFHVGVASGNPDDIAAAAGRSYNAKIGLEEATATRAKQQADWYGKRGEQAEQTQDMRDITAKDALAEKILGNPTMMGTPLWEAAAAHANARFGVQRQPDVADLLARGGKPPAPAQPGKPPAGGPPAPAPAPTPVPGPVPVAPPRRRAAYDDQGFPLTP